MFKLEEGRSLLEKGLIKYINEIKLELKKVLCKFKLCE